MEEDPRNKSFYLMLDMTQLGVSGFTLLEGVLRFMNRSPNIEHGLNLIPSAAFIALGLIGGIDSIRKIRKDKNR